MRHLAILLALISSAFAAPPAMVNHTVAGNQGGGNYQTGSFDITGANTVLVYSVTYNSGGNPCAVPLSDNFGNTFTALTGIISSNVGGCWYVAVNAHGGPGYTLYVGWVTYFSTVFVSAWSGLDTTNPIDQQASGATVGANPFQIGPVTPAQNGEIIVSAIGEYHNGADNFSVSDGVNSWNILDHLASSASMGGAIGYFIQSTAGTVNPTWQHNDSLNAGTVGNVVTLIPHGPSARRRILN